MITAHLDKPPVIGAIDIGLLQRMHHSLEFSQKNNRNPLASITREGIDYRRKTDIFVAFTKMIVELVASYEGVDTGASMLTIVPFRTIVPVGEVTVTVASAWHRDSRRYVVSNVLPTEFLVGAPQVPKKHSADTSAYFNSSQFAQYEADYVYRPLVGDVVGLDMSHLHRSAINDTDHQIDRMFIQVLSQR